MRGRTIGGRRTPSPPTNPPEPKHTHSDHDVFPEDAVYDFDGPGVDEAEAVEGDVLTVVRERLSCRRDGCDASGGDNHIYTTEGVSDRLMAALEYASNDKYEEAVLEYFAMNAVIVDYDETPIVGVEFGDDVLGYVYPETSQSAGRLGGTCHGQPEPPDPEGQWRDI